MLLSIDIGTTNIKVGLYKENGSFISTVSEKTPYETNQKGIVYIPAQGLWNTVAKLIKETAPQNGRVQAFGITSMAESGLLIDRDTGVSLSEIIPWFESSCLNQAKLIESEIDPFEQFCQTGLHPSFKYGLSKLLWLKNKDRSLLDNKSTVWVSVSSFIAYCLTGNIAEEQSLAARTFVYQINKNEWNNGLIRHFGLNPDLFPEVKHCLEPIGMVKQELGFDLETPVFIAGHDHVCSSLAAGILSEGNVYNSIGTAETLVGTFRKRELTSSDYESGLSFGLHPFSHLYFWMGGHSSSGGSVEWIRSIMGDPLLTYGEINQLLEKAGNHPGEILFFPYLSGSGLPSPNPNSKAAFLGLKRSHGKGDILKAILEGNAFQMERIRNLAEKTTGIKIHLMNVIGGGVRNKHWVQIKANVSGNTLVLPSITEAALSGAALIAATGAGIFSSLKEAVEKGAKNNEKIVMPEIELHKAYRTIYERQYEPLSEIIKIV